MAHVAAMPSEKRMSAALSRLRLLLSAVACLALFVPASAWGADIPGYPQHVTAYDAREVALLPKYCIYTQLFRDHVPGGNNQAEIKRWYATMGDIFHAMHHYCYGLMYMHRAKVLARDPQVRVFNFNTAIVEFDYVLDRAPKDFALLPEIITRKGEALVRLGRPVPALELFERAIEMRPDYWLPYALMSDHYVSVGATEKAREILERGLSQAAGARGLQRRLAELDGAAPKRAGKSPSE